MGNSFAIPESGNGLQYMYNGTSVDSWGFSTIYRTHDNYTAIGGKTVNAIRIDISSGKTVNGVVAPMFTDDGSRPSEFYEYTGSSTYTIDLGGTRYGGTLDVTTGVLTVDRAIYTITGSESWTAWGTHAYFANVLPSMSVDKDNTINCISSIAAGNTVAAIYTGGSGIGTRSTRLYISTDVHANIGSLTGQQVCYELATPFEVQLTAEDDITTLLGQNNIWSDTGDIEVEYRADTKLYIEKLTAPTEDDMIADHAISANSFFMVGNTLYRATTAIASGATITVGTNATKMSLSDALNALA